MAKGIAIDMKGWTIKHEFEMFEQHYLVDSDSGKVWLRKLDAIKRLKDITDLEPPEFIKAFYIKEIEVVK